MKKIGIITWHSIPNHGGMLQMYALSKTLQNMGMETCFVLHKIVLEKNQEKIKRTRFFKISYWLWFINDRTGRAFNEKKNKELLEFQMRTFDITKSCDCLDAVCIGSDEVFSLSNGYTPEFFGENLTSIVFSYAGSFGQTNLETIRSRGLESRIKSNFSKFYSISVRDENSKALVQQLGFSEVYQHIDPVLLYGYSKVLAQVNCESKQQVIVYSYDANMNSLKEQKYIRSFAKKQKCKVISAGFYHYWCDESINYSPIEIIKEFAKSKFIITDTFHGAVLSIITHSQFAVLVRKNNSNKITSLLRSLGLEDRIMSDISDLDILMTKETDYGQVESKLNRYRDEANDYLKECAERVFHGE